MMLLQAGQAGLYRRDSIWTDELPPDMMPGATLWIDGSSTSWMYVGNALTPPHPELDGESLLGVENRITARYGFEFSSGTSLSLQLSSTPSGKSTIRADKVATTFMNRAGGAGTDGPAVPTAVFSDATKTIVAAVRVATEIAYTNDVVGMPEILACSGYYGLVFHKDAGQLYVRGFNAATNFVTSQVVRPVPAAAFFVVTLTHQSNQLRLRVNGGAWDTAASQATRNLTQQPLMLAPREGLLEVAHLFGFNSALSDAAINAAERWVAKDVGIAPW